LLVIVGTYLMHSPYDNSKFAMGALTAAVIRSGRAMAPLAQIANLAIRYQQAKVGMQCLHSIIDRKIERDPEREYISLEHVAGELNLQQVSFKYQDDTPEVVKGVQLQLK